MSFKSFIKEDYSEGSIVVRPNIDPETITKINLMLFIELQKPFLTAEAGVVKVRKVLGYYGFLFEPLYYLEPEGDEIVVELETGDYLYILFYPTDEGYYEFYAEVTNEEGIEDLLNSGTEGESQNT